MKIRTMQSMCAFCRKKISAFILKEKILINVYSCMMNLINPLVPSLLNIGR